MNLNFYSKFEKIAIYILPFSLVFSIFLSDLLVSILTIGFLIKSIKKKNFKILNNKFFKIFIIFWIYTLLISLLSENIFISLKSAIPYFRFILLPIIIYQICLEDKNFLKNFFFSISYFFLILVIDSSIQFFYEKNIVGYISTENGRIQVYLKMNIFLVALFLKYFVISALIFYFEKNKKRSYFIFFVVYISSLFVIIISGDRTPYFYFLFHLFLFFSL